jgi:hypothetical protein
MEFDSFQAYCEAKWDYGRRYVDQMISETQVFTYLSPNRRQKPDNETQVRPLAGLTLEQVQLACERAADLAGSGKMTEHLVKRALQEVQFAAPAKPAAKKAGPTQAERRRLIDDTIGQLLALVSQKADHGLLQANIEALHGHIRALFPKAASGVKG